MIVITGPGRSGTSVLAAVYKELGFDPGGFWLERTRAGLEDPRFYSLNNRMAAQLGMTMLKRLPKAAESAGDEEVTFEPADWDRLDGVVEYNRDAMLELARDTEVVKDPRFSYLLPVWLAAGAAIDHVVITTRDLDAMVASRLAAGQTELSASELRKSLNYAIGVVSAAVTEHDVPHTWLQFPDFLRDPAALYEVLPFPRPVERKRFTEAAERLFDAGKVHDWRGGTASARFTQ
jgi:hypothetical protein